jgi:hypothetical protein
MILVTMAYVAGRSERALRQGEYSLGTYLGTKVDKPWVTSAE